MKTEDVPLTADQLDARRIVAIKIVRRAAMERGDHATIVRCNHALSLGRTERVEACEGILALEDLREGVRS